MEDLLMKLVFAVLLLPLAAYAINPALPVARVESGIIVEQRPGIPSRYIGARGETVNYDAAGESVWYADGWRQWVACLGVDGSNVVTYATIDDGQTLTAVDCRYEAVIAPIPAQYENGIAVKRDGHWIEFVPHEGDVIAVQVSDSPIDPVTRDARIAAAVASAKADKSTWRADMQSFRGSVSTNIADVQAIASLPAGFTAAQNRAAVNALRSELIDAFREINQLRKLLRKYAREQAEEQ